MRPTPDKMSAFLAQLKKKMNLKSLVVTLAAIVVFTTTYLLILPAFTLDKEEALEQGGIDVVAVETAADTDQAEEVVEETTAEPEKVVEPKAETGKAEAATEAEKSGKSESVSKPTAKLLTKQKTITAEQAKGDDFEVSAVVDRDAKVPADVTITATELDKKTEDFDYDQYKKDVLEALKKDSSDVKGIKSIKFYDISLESESQDDSVKPEAPVSVKIAYEDGIKVDNADNVRIVHFAEQKNGEVRISLNGATPASSSYGANQSNDINQYGVGSYAGSFRQVTENNRSIRTYGQHNDDTGNYNLDAAVTVATSIIEANKHFYAVGTFGDATNMQRLGGQYYSADDQEALTNAFAEIVQSITNSLTLANVQINDGVTAMSTTSFVHGNVGDFKYYKDDVEWNPTADGAGTASCVDKPDGTKQVTWNLGANYKLDPNVEYKVTFTVWPSQSAYDLLADLNNHIIEWGDTFTYVDSEGHTQEIPFSQSYSTIEITARRRHRGSKKGR